MALDLVSGTVSSRLMDALGPRGLDDSCQIRVDVGREVDEAQLVALIDGQAGEVGAEAKAAANGGRLLRKSL